MAAWPRTVVPISNTDFDVPGPQIARAQSGKVNVRATTQRGRTWTETYMLKVSDEDAKAFLAYVRATWRAGTSFDIVHRDYLTPNGSAEGTPLVKGANQTGSTIDVDGIAGTPGADWLLAGDIISFAGINCVYDVTADVTEAAGEATIPISPPIYTGGSPADDAAVTTTGVAVRAIIAEPPDWPDTSGDSADWGTLTVRFVETLE